MEKRFSDVPPKTRDRITIAPRAWSSVVKGDYLPARVEIRLEEMEGAEREISEERLKRIRTAIPDAKAIIYYLRASNKVLVVVRN